MLHNIQQNTDWKSKYQDVLDDLEARELEWTQIEELLRKARVDEGFDEDQWPETLNDIVTSISDSLKNLDHEKRAKLLYDALTGVYSRMAYDERIAQELARWTRYQTPFSYVILDIDHFKRVNDNYGHNAGDKALKLVAQMMLKYVRQSDYVFRIDGEEFVLLLTSISVDNAATMVEKMRAGIAASSFHFKGEPINLTLSAGITETRINDDVEVIYERADKALYKAKNSGRNCQFLAD